MRIEFEWAEPKIGHLAYSRLNDGDLFILRCVGHRDWVGNFIDKYNLTPSKNSQMANVRQLNKEEAAEFVQIYPNPAQDKIINDFLGTPSNKWVFEVFGWSGSDCIARKNDRTLNNPGIDIGALGEGLYFYRLRFDNYISTGRLIKN